MGPSWKSNCETTVKHHEEALAIAFNTQGFTAQARTYVKHLEQAEAALQDPTQALAAAWAGGDVADSYAAQCGTRLKRTLSFARVPTTGPMTAVACVILGVNEFIQQFLLESMKARHNAPLACNRVLLSCAMQSLGVRG